MLGLLSLRFLFKPLSMNRFNFCLCVLQMLCEGKLWSLVFEADPECVNPPTCCTVTAPSSSLPSYLLSAQSPVHSSIENTTRTKTQQSDTHPSPTDPAAGRQLAIGVDIPRHADAPEQRPFWCPQAATASASITAIYTLLVARCCRSAPAQGMYRAISFRTPRLGPSSCLGMFPPLPPASSGPRVQEFEALEGRKRARASLSSAIHPASL